MKTIIVIQARMGSSRLPGKILMPLGEGCVLDYVVTRCRLVHQVADVIVATSMLPQDDAVEAWCRSRGVSCHRGPEDDVLTRYVEASAPHKPDYVIRVTADCPFVDYRFADGVIQAMAANPSDIVVFEGQLPRGLNVEMLSYEALLRIDRLGHEPWHREHVTYYAYQYPGLFRQTVFPVPHPLRYPQLRVTLDTPEDYALCQTVAEAFHGQRTVPSDEVIAFLLQHPEVAALNAHVEQKPVVHSG